MGLPQVSVVLPVYNREHDVVRAIQSIQGQSFPNWELIIRDDGSSDGTLEVCRAIADKDGRIQVSTNGTNLGLAKTMNRLVSSARGSYIAVQEHDDVSLPERLAREVDVLDSHPEVGLVTTLTAFVDEAGKTMMLFPGLLQRGEQYPEDPQELVRLLYVFQSKIPNGACMFRRSVLDGIPGPFDAEARMSIDWQFFVHVAHKHRVYGIPDVLYLVQRGASNQSLSTRTELRFSEARRCLRVLFEHYRDDLKSPINYRLYRRAMATQLVMEGRSYGRWKGSRRLLEALFYDPLNRLAYRSLWEMGLRAISTPSRLAIPRRPSNS